MHDQKHGPAFVSMVCYRYDLAPERHPNPQRYPTLTPAPDPDPDPNQVHNLLSPLESSTVLHVDVCFGTPPSLRLAEQLDAAIGHAACAHALAHAPTRHMAYTHTHGPPPLGGRHRPPWPCLRDHP